MHSLRRDVDNKSPRRPWKASSLAMIMASPTLAAADLEVIPTFESAGIYYDIKAGGDPRADATVRYRAVGGEWRPGVDMDFSPREQQFRSSIARLAAGTEYEVEVHHRDEILTVAFSTWEETDQWPIGKTTTADGAIVVRESGTSEGYHLIEGTKVTGGERCVGIRADYVIVRGFECVGQTDDPITVNNNRHDIVIEDNEIRQWKKGNAIDMGSYPASTTHRIVIQRNRIHDPAWGNSDEEWDNSNGVRGITLWEEQGGNHVWRYNTVTATREQMFSDAFGAGRNFGLAGFPGSDTDIYGNYVTHCGDDCFELEGGGMNVRVWNNYFGEYGVAIAIAAVSRGPIYIFRNVLGPANGLASGDGLRSGAVKVAGTKCSECGDFHGRHHVYHNTFVNVPGYDGSQLVAGNHWGGAPRAGTYRNNIIQVADGEKALRDGKPCWSGRQSNDLDYDLYWGKGDFRCGNQEAHGINAKPQFSRFTVEARPGTDAWFQLTRGSPGHDDGAFISNFSQDYLGSGPDRGAHETGAPPICFGHSC